MKYDILTDTHCHTISSGHAYNTISELAAAAAEKGLEAIAMTDHGPMLTGAPAEIYFSNLCAIPEKICGVSILKGAEANIINYDGKLDLSEGILKSLDIVIASIHSYLLTPGNIQTHTSIWREIAKNPYVDIIGHSGQEDYHYDYEEGIKCFKRYNKIVEINSSSMRQRRGADVNCRQIAELCKIYEVPVVICSDAHFCSDIGNFNAALELLNDVNFPVELIVNRNETEIKKALLRRRGDAGTVLTVLSRKNRPRVPARVPENRPRDTRDT